MNFLDCVTNTWYKTSGLEYPKESGIPYLGGASLSVGGVVGRDTLVSTSFPYELAPDQAPFGYIIEHSIHDPEEAYVKQAVSEQDYISSCTDTWSYDKMPDYSYDFLRGTYHIPMGIQVDQESYAWSYDYAEDFILVKLKISNIDTNVIRDMYIGIESSARANFFDGAWLDDMCGLLKDYPSGFGCGFVDTLNIAWGADNDGDPVDGKWLYTRNSDGIRSARDVAGLMVLQKPYASAKMSYNWWVSPSNDTRQDYGPMKQDNYRDFRTGGSGRPEGDANLYYIMSNGEIDFDQIYTSKIDPWDQTWIYPNQEFADDWTNGSTPNFILSYGPINLYPGGETSIAFAVVAGENLHTEPYNLNYLPDRPERFYDNLDFSDLALNAMWAEWIYDNPGVDTDGDGDFGDFAFASMTRY